MNLEESLKHDVKRKSLKNPVNPVAPKPLPPKKGIDSLPLCVEIFLLMLSVLIIRKVKQK
jgi:hypothetical protein